MTVLEATTRAPWPGPRPYAESDRTRFFGREADADKLLRRLDAERLVLLTAPSTVGKTSFVRAAVVPELRERRREAIEDDDLSLFPAVVVVRDWTAPDLSDADRFFIDAVHAGIAELQEEAAAYDAADAACILADFARLDGVEAGRETQAFNYITNLAAATEGGVTLVLDQFEEALLGSKRHVARVSELIGRLYKASNVNVRLLISFREEYLTRFTAIGRVVGDLGRRLFTLQPIEGDPLRRVLRESARSGGVTLHEDALDELFNWLETADEVDDQSATSSRGTKVRRTPGSVQASDSAIDLLKLQALLLQLYEIAARTEGGGIAISLETLDQLRYEAFGEGKETDGEELVERALQRYIDGWLPLPPGVADASGLPADLALSDDDWRKLRRRRAAGRIGSSLSSGGFKLQQELSDLLARAWREEWEVLGIDVDEVQQALENEGDLEVGHIDVFTGLLESTQQDEDAPEDIWTLSGIAKQRSWSISDTGNDLIDVSVEMLEMLASDEINVLRRKVLQDGDGARVIYELVHDGFADPFDAWAEEVRSQPVDALGATTAERGSVFRWARLTGAVKDVCWRGCWVGPSPDAKPDPERGKRLSVENVVFEDCDFRGTVFDRCDFRGGAFRNCNLGGTVFWDCTFTGTETEPFLFDNIDSSGVSFDDGSVLRHVHFTGDCRMDNMSWESLTIDNVVLHRCVLNQLTVVRDQVTLAGPLVFSESWIVLSDLVGLARRGEDGQDLFQLLNCDLYYCRLDEEADRAVDRDKRNRHFPDPGDLSDEPSPRHDPTKDLWQQYAPPRLMTEETTAARL